MTQLNLRVKKSPSMWNPRYRPPFDLHSALLTGMGRVFFEWVGGRSVPVACVYLSLDSGCVSSLFRFILASLGPDFREKWA